ncbi:MAG: motB, partial [Geminicoccaceae bacterium]|nr:motB [Geminicoccaceae bacterium]
RADATRRMLVAAGLDQGRIATVIGKADTEHMVPDAPRDPRNRRISITLLRQEPVAADTLRAALCLAGCAAMLIMRTHSEKSTSDNCA